MHGFDRILIFLFRYYCDGNNKLNFPNSVNKLKLLRRQFHNMLPTMSKHSQTILIVAIRTYELC